VFDCEVASTVGVSGLRLRIHNERNRGKDCRSFLDRWIRAGTRSGDNSMIRPSRVNRVSRQNVRKCNHVILRRPVECTLSFRYRSRHRSRGSIADSRRRVRFGSRLQLRHACASRRCSDNAREITIDRSDRRDSSSSLKRSRTNPDLGAPRFEIDCHRRVVSCLNEDSHRRDEARGDVDSLDNSRTYPWNRAMVSDADTKTYIMMYKRSHINWPASRFAAVGDDVNCDRRVSINPTFEIPPYLHRCW